MNIAEWNNQNQNDRYPFNSGCSMRSLDGYTLSDGFLSDAQVQSGPGVVWLQKISIQGDVVTGVVFIGDNELGRFEFNRSSINGSAATIVGNDGTHLGTVVAGPGANYSLLSLNSGDNVFSKSSTEFESSCCIPVVNSVTGILIDEKTNRGKIILVEGVGIQFVKISDQELQINAIGSTENKDACCNGKQGLLGINDVYSDSFGNIQFDIGEFSEPKTKDDLRQILRISSTANGVVFYLSKQ